MQNSPFNGGNFEKIKIDRKCNSCLIGLTNNIVVSVSCSFSIWCTLYSYIGILSILTQTAILHTFVITSCFSLTLGVYL